MYEVLLTGGPGTGYAIARSAGLARANAYSALEGLVSKGAARVDPGRPKRYRPEAPPALIARISTGHGLAFEQLSSELDAVSRARALRPWSRSSLRRAVLQLITHDVASAWRSRCSLLAPARRVSAPRSGPSPTVFRRSSRSRSAATSPVDLGFVEVEVLPGTDGWPGMPILSVVDDRSAIMASRSGSEVQRVTGALPRPSSLGRGSPSIDLRGHP